MEEEEDTPIMEIPIHIAKRLCDKLFIFQYLDKFPDRNINKTNIIKGTVKPKNQEVSLEVGLNIKSANYDTSKGEQIAINTDGMTGLLAEKEKEDKYFNNVVMDKQYWTSTKAVSDSSSYAVGILSQNEIHLTPIKSILQMRPDLEYLDKAEKRNNKTQKNSDSADEDVDDPSTSGENEPTKVTVRFARTETEKTKKNREQSFAHLSKQSAEEPWINAKWFHMDSHEAELELTNLYSSQTQDVSHALSLNSKTYLKQLIPPSIDLSESSTNQDISISLAELKILPLVDQCQTLMKDAKIITFDQLNEALSISSDKKDELLRVLPQAAVLVKGVWIVRSELLYPSNTFSATCGVPSESMCRARDYVLYLFNTHDFVDRRKVAVAVKIPPAELREIFNGISVYESHQGWRLSLATDNDFLARYPDIAQRQQLFWDTKSRYFSEYLRDFNKPVRHRKRSTRESVGSDADVPKLSGVNKRDNSFSSDNDSGTERNQKSPSVSKKRCKIKTSDSATSGTNHVFMKKPITSE